eukprot:GHVU01086244.1.p1 GENE.GHVU01086244.1~~GHVU01086244.1.p1  ORF type:complete len:315 (-),score=41.61 GHVU01086244.1:1247-2191(-)
MGLLQALQHPLVGGPIALMVAIVAAGVFLSYFAPRRGFLDATTRQFVTILDKTYISPDTVRLRLTLPNKDYHLGLPVGQHIRIYCKNTVGSEPGKWNGRPDIENGMLEACRKYTPITNSYEEKGFFDLVIKVYQPNEKFVDGGKVTRYLDTLKTQELLEIHGPVGSHQYHGKGVFSKSGKKHEPANYINMIAGGTGITPMIRVMKEVLREPEKKIRIALIFANCSPSDILLRSFLDEQESQHPNQLKIWYTVDKGEPGWKYSEGYVNEDMIRERLYPASSDTVTLLCGPRPMVQFACLPNLTKLGHDESRCLAL